MKATAVSALRSKRGLHRVSGAEPQVVGLTPQTTLIRRTDTMKTYLLRNPNPVEPQKPVRFLDAFAGSLDLHALGFDQARCAPTGRPP